MRECSGRHLVVAGVARLLFGFLGLLRVATSPYSARELDVKIVSRLSLIFDPAGSPTADMFATLLAVHSFHGSPALLRPVRARHASAHPVMIGLREQTPTYLSEAQITDHLELPEVVRVKPDDDVTNGANASDGDGALDGGLGVWGWRAALLLVTVSWAANFPVTAGALDALGPSAEHASLFLAGRFLSSAVLLAPAALTASSAGAVQAGATIGGLCAFGYVAQAAALAMGSQAATCAFICSLQAVVVALYTALSGRGLTFKTTVAVALAVCGIGCLELPGVLEGGLDALCLGDLVALGQPLGFGMSYIVIEQAMKDHPDDELPLAALQCILIGAATLGIASASAGAAPWQLPFDILLPAADAASPAEAWMVPGAVLYTGVWGTAATIWLQAAVFKRLPAVDASVILSTEPLWATGLAAVMLGDVIGMTDVMGGALIISALLINEGLIQLPGVGEQSDEAGTA